MAFGHEKLDVNRATSEYVGWVYRFCEALAGEGMRFTKRRKRAGRIKSTPIPIPTPTPRD